MENYLRHYNDDLLAKLKQMVILLASFLNYRSFPSSNSEACMKLKQDYSNFALNIFQRKPILL